MIKLHLKQEKIIEKKEEPIIKEKNYFIIEEDMLELKDVKYNEMQEDNKCII
jgi:hypothetical protein